MSIKAAVTGAPPVRGSGGMPQRIVTISVPATPGARAADASAGSASGLRGCNEKMRLGVLKRAASDSRFGVPACSFPNRE